MDYQEWVKYDGRQVLTPADVEVIRILQARAAQQAAALIDADIQRRAFEQAREQANDEAFLRAIGIDPR